MDDQPTIYGEAMRLFYIKVIYRFRIILHGYSLDTHLAVLSAALRLRSAFALQLFPQNLLLYAIIEIVSYSFPQT